MDLCRSADQQFLSDLSARSDGDACGQRFAREKGNRFCLHPFNGFNLRRLCFGYLLGKRTDRKGTLATSHWLVVYWNCTPQLSDEPHVLGVGREDWQAES